MTVATVIAVSGTLGGGVSAAFHLRRTAPAESPTYVICRGDPGHLPEPPDFVFGNGREAGRWLRGVTPCVLVPNWIWNLYGVADRLKRRGHPIRVVGYCRSDEVGYYRKLAALRGGIDAFVAVSPECAATLAQHLSPPAPVAVLPSPVERPTRLSRTYQTRPIRIAYAGRLVQEFKRVLDLPAVAAELLRREVDFTFDIIGDGPQLAELFGRVSTLRHRGRIRFLGTISNRDMAYVWSRHDVCTLFSEVEGLSCSMLEAMACGAVPVVTRVASGIDGVVVDGRTGFLVPVGDAEAMAEAIVELSHSPSRLRRIGGAAHRQAAPYALPEFLDKWRLIVDPLIQNLDAQVRS